MRRADDKAQRFLVASARRVREAMPKIHAEIGELVISRIAENASVRSGRLASSFTATADENGVSISSPLPYVGVQEARTGFLTASIYEAHRPLEIRLDELLGNALEAAAEEVGSA